MVRNECEHAEILAGAIALCEASDLEREQYRAHLASCAACIAAIGGEREIERVMATIARARDAETWEPVIAPPWQVAARSRNRAWRIGATAAGVALAASLGVHAFFAYGLNAVKPTPVNPIVIDYDGRHITLERHVPVAKPAEVAKAQARPMVVLHNVARLEGPRPVALPEAPRKPRIAVKHGTIVVAQGSQTGSAAASDTPIWRMNPAGVASANAAAAAQAPLPLEHRAESMAVAVPPSIREVEPIGGDAAIDPVPPMIAYAEGANGTTAFELSINEHGVPTKCTITKASGYLVLDHAVCKAAMRARFLPRTINGRGVPSVYRDAFTFPSNADQ